MIDNPKTSRKQGCRSSAGIDVRKLWDELRPTRARDYLPTQAESPWGNFPGATPLKVWGSFGYFWMFDFLWGARYTEPVQGLQEMFDISQGNRESTLKGMHYPRDHEDHQIDPRIRFQLVVWSFWIKSWRILPMAFEFCHVALAS